MSNRFLHAQTVITSLRDNGYSNTAYALAELIDNSLQAKATRVELGFIEEQAETGKRKNFSVAGISLWDNGIGMSPETLRVAMQFGGGEHRKDTEGMGKFGMGLPNSSISQCKRVDVWSWKNGSMPYHTFLDVDEMANGKLEEVPEPVQDDIPEIYKKSHFGSIPPSGTFILWSKLDRLNWKTGKSIFTHCDKLVGRLYRNFIHSDEIKIESRTYRHSGANMLSVLESRLFKANDPMYLLKNTSLPELPGAYKNESFFELFDEQEIPLSYTNSENEEVNGTVYIRSSIVKESIANAILASSTTKLGYTDWGKDCKKNIGVSIVRAGRELVLRDSFLNQGFRDYEGRFIGVEVCFPPSLDELFGVTNNKQDAINLIPYDKEKMREELGFDLLSEYMKDLEDNDDNLALVLKVTDNIKNMVKAVEKRLGDINLLPRKNISGAPTGTSPAEKATAGSNYRETHGNKTDDYQKPLNKQEVEQIISDIGLPPEVAKSIIEKELRFYIDSKAMDSDAFFDVSTRAGLTLVLFNTNHVFYNEMIVKLPPQERETLEIVMASFARVMNEEGQSDGKLNFLNNIRRAWGKVVTEFINGPSEEDIDLFEL
ncbi:ATP-binding protein [Scandinavium goeteborgense]|uniref:ATP-binding protein n=1 Tax=Scandinavium goeteborgense TaxID=1851514 RepID=UPI000F669100|nr:ATP-binding protein [Scandinavium goeteborgense]QKN83450.1 ATP-binding protein [Scandinavium goeteborgense]